MTVLTNRTLPATNQLRLAVIDPGKTTGMCIAKLVKDGDLSVKVYYYTMAVGPWPEAAKALDIRVPYDTNLIVMEDWRLQADKANSLIGDNLPGARVAGFFEGLAYLRDKPIVWQQPSETNLMYPVARDFLKPRDLWPPTEHERDAITHLVVYLTKRGEWYE